jgi:hypothetical protein
MIGMLPLSKASPHRPHRITFGAESAVPQEVLSPSDVSATGTISIARLPASARAFGYIPDLKLCSPGDLILSRSVKPGLIDRQIAKTQARIGFADEHKCWTHAAVFLYEDFIVEATPEAGVATRSLYEDVPDSVLRVRRCPGLSETERYRIALCAQRMLGLRYDAEIAFAAGILARFTNWKSYWFPLEGKTVVCSKVYYDAHVEITHRTFRDCPLNDLVTPAHLSATPDLEDVRVPWLEVQ